MTKLLQASNSQIILEDVQFMFKPNFAGRQEKYNREGDRYFNVVVNPEDADILQQYGVNVKVWEPKAKDAEMEKKIAENPDMYEPQCYFKVRVYTQFSVPSVAIIYDDGETPIDAPINPSQRTYFNEDQLGLIDEMEIALCDMVIRRREPSEDGTYARLDLKSAYIRVAANPLERKYGF